MKNLKILSLFAVILSIFFYAGLAAAEETAGKSEQEAEIVWKNPLPKMLQQMKHRAEETLDELKRDDFPFCDFETLPDLDLDILIQDLDEEINKLHIQRKNKEAAALTRKKNKIVRLAGILYEYKKYTDFYRQGEEYIKMLKEQDWIIHFHNPEIFRDILNQFNDSRYRFQLDKELNISFDRVVIFSSNDIEFPNALITGIIKYDNLVKDKLREDMVAFYFRGHLNNPMAIWDSEIFELRWLDSEGQKHVVWHPVMPYPFPIPVPVSNSLY